MKTYISNETMKNIESSIAQGWSEVEAITDCMPGTEMVRTTGGQYAAISFDNMELVQTLASAFLMKVVVLKKYDCETNWSITEDFEDIDNSKGLDVMGYFKGIDDATVFDTVEDVEDAYNEYTDNLQDQYASDQEILLDELTKAQKGKDEIIEQVKHKNPSDFVMIWNDDADSLEVMHKFSTILYDGFNQVSYALGLVLKED